MADLKTTIKPVGKLKSSLGASSMNVVLGRAVDWNQNDETANDYVKNRPGAYTISNSVDIEWDGNLEGKEVVWLNTRPVNGLKFGFVKIADEAPPIEKFAAKAENAGATSYKARSITVSQRTDGTISESDETVELTVDASGKYYKLYNDIVFVLADSAEVHSGHTYTQGIWCYTATRDTTQPQGTVLKQYVRRIASTDGTVVKIPKKYLEVEDPPVKDVRIAGTSILADGVANVPIASNEVLGAVKSKQGIVQISKEGYVFPMPATTWDIDGRIANNTYEGLPNSRAIIPPSRLDYAVKAAMCDGKGAAWTAAEQQAARDRMGLDKPYELIEEIVFGEDSSVTVERTTAPDGTPYSFSVMRVQILSMPSAKTGINALMYFGNSSHPTYIYSYIAVTNVRADLSATECVEATLRGGYWMVTIKDNSGSADIVSNGSWTGRIRTTEPSAVLSLTAVDLPTIESLQIIPFTGEKVFPSGTIIRIYGVRA